MEAVKCQLSLGPLQQWHQVLLRLGNQTTQSQTHPVHQGLLALPVTPSILGGEILTSFILPHFAAIACSGLGTAQLHGRAGTALQQLLSFRPCPSLGQQAPVQGSDEPT